MKTRILLYLLTLGCTTFAQSPLERDLNLHQPLSSHHFTMTENMVKSETADITPHHTRRIRAEQATHTVSFVLDFDAETQYASDVILLNQDGKINGWELGLWQLNIGSNIATIPEGIYDILVIFAETENNGTQYQHLHHLLYVIHEQVSIEQDMQLEFSSSEAKNHINIQTLTIDGQPVNTGTNTLDENGMLTPIEQGNMDEVFFQNRIFCEEYGEIYNLWQRFGSTTEIGECRISNYELLGDFYVNDVSERYAFGSYRAAVDFDFNIYTTYNEVLGASSDVTIANDPSKFILYEEPFMYPQQQNNDFYHSVTLFLQNNNGSANFSHRIFFPLSISEVESIKCYIGANAEESAVGYIPFTQLETYYNKKIVDDEGYEYDIRRTFISSIPVTNTNGIIVSANNGTCNHGSSVPNYWHFEQEWDEINKDVKKYPLWPSHPIFTYSVDKKKGTLGNNCPIITTNFMQYEGSYTYENYEGNLVTSTWIDNIFYYQYLGRYGEITLDHLEKSQISLKLNDETIYKGPGLFVENDGESPLWFDELFEGVVDATITNETVYVDDLAGANKALLHYTAGAEDENPPTMTMLHFKDNSNNVTDRFTRAEEGEIEFSAVDFDFMYTPNNYYTYFRKAPETVQVEYAPYRTDDWNELAVEELPEYYWPSMGWFYRGSLVGVTGQAEKGWFDLKIRLVDAAGNWQEQVISPAFRIDDLAYTSVATITPASKSGDSAIYNLAGQRMRGDLNTLPHGIYIVNGKKVVK